jgi:cyclopropane fatty-acyl-phospholipid synthase-like methyltransferase
MGATMLEISESEKQHWREGLAKDDSQNELIAMAILCAFTKPKSWLDVGCGTGAVARTAMHNGIEAYGVDQLVDEALRGWIAKTWDLRLPLNLERTFDLVTCIEVAEHLEEEYEGVICDTLVRHVAEGGRLVFTAAKPGQGGYNHFNCQPQKYWRDRMESRGLKYSQADTLRLAEIWKWTFTALHHLEENLQVFRR